MIICARESSGEKCVCVFVWKSGKWRDTIERKKRIHRPCKKSIPYYDWINVFTLSVAQAGDLLDCNIENLRSEKQEEKYLFSFRYFSSGYLCMEQFLHSLVCDIYLRFELFDCLRCLTLSACVLYSCQNFWFFFIEFNFVLLLFKWKKKINKTNWK